MKARPDNRNSLSSANVAGSLRIIKTWGELDQLANAWDELAAKSGGPMYQHIWVRCCLANSAAQNDLRILVLEGSEKPAAIAPLVERGHRLKRLELLAVDGMDEPMDFIYAEVPALAALADGLVKFGRPLFLKRILAESPVVAALRESFRGRGLVMTEPMPGCPWIPLDDSWMEPERHFDSGRRSDLRRMRRIAERMGVVHVEVLAPSPRELGPLLQEAFEVEIAGWKGRKGSAILSDAKREALHRRYAVAAAEKGILRLSFLRIGSRAAAMQLAVEYGGGFWLLKIGYDEQFARCSPGTLLTVETLRWAAERGLRSYEFLGKVEPWTKVWTRHVRPCLALWAYPAELRSMTHLTADFPKIVYRRLRQLIEPRT